MEKKIICKKCKGETERLTGLGVCPECDKIISEEAAGDINFLDLVSLPLMDMESLLAAMKAILGEAAGEDENHLLNLVRLAERERRKIQDQLDRYIDGEDTAKKAYESLSVEVA